MKQVHSKFPCGADVVATMYDNLIEIRLSAPNRAPHYHVQDTSSETYSRLDGNELTFGIFKHSIPALQKLLTAVKRTIKAKK